jgi:hypothetical protein
MFFATYRTNSNNRSASQEIGRATAQEVSGWLPASVARVRARSGNVGFVVDKVALGQVLSEYFGFLCQLPFHQIIHPHNHPGQVTIGQLVADGQGGPTWTPTPTIRI